MRLAVDVEVTIKGRKTVETVEAHCFAARRIRKAGDDVARPAAFRPDVVSVDIYVPTRVRAILQSADGWRPNSRSVLRATARVSQNARELAPFMSSGRSKWFFGTR
ncbi:hypothetical protein DF027_21340 [Burkholderia cenocepacia]|uniref:hypothetical protein n=1 Tax=Burkholderia cenocepacia TaxID=95486 RepID=UPI000F5743F2|nr:hypothetical protein [Burkholderia cenocepacia]RQV39133.1 hypothetical protein DF027_21340 [Burkholderia cenocepacia]RQV41198.1 hypothetical protein DF028_14235 [Burkholderia cenocepacia]RQV78055.1 hypothetical protein DF010_14640 [Burkholderia cenocepacia]